ncbi:hypothetical protein, partial [Rhizobium glycinendophyticum]|uniref:hypothetical protein n=1 Tax=Rhizobium glycinendophyticum TaxID=2589807 RepID=UPI001ABFB9C2
PSKNHPAKPEPGIQSASQPISLRFSLNQTAARLVGAALSFGEAAYTATPFSRQQPDSTFSKRSVIPL